jgi:hypothetical protein
MGWNMRELFKSSRAKDNVRARIEKHMSGNCLETHIISQRLLGYRRQP